MSNKKETKKTPLLKEHTIRKFMKLANLQPIADEFITEKYSYGREEEQEYYEGAGPGEKRAQYVSEMPGEDEELSGGDMPPDPSAGELGDEMPPDEGENMPAPGTEGLVKDLVDAIMGAIEQVSGVDISVSGGEEGLDSDLGGGEELPPELPGEEEEELPPPPMAESKEIVDEEKEEVTEKKEVDENKEEVTEEKEVVEEETVDESAENVYKGKPDQEWKPGSNNTGEDYKAGKKKALPNALQESVIKEITRRVAKRLLDQSKVRKQNKGK